MRVNEHRLRIIAGLLLLLVVSGGLAELAQGQGEQLGLVRFVKTEYPGQVPASYTFSIKLTIEYAWRKYTDIYTAIYEGPTGTFDRPLWESKSESVIEVGRKSYEAQMKSPSSEGPWLLTAYAFFRNESGAYYSTDQESGPGFVEISIIVADNAKLTIWTPYDSVMLQVDGSPYSTDASGILVRNVRVQAEHTIALPENVQVAEGVRAIFLSWNGTDTANPKTVLVTGDLLLTAEFKEEYYLDVVSSVPGVSGAGWYRAGVVADISAPLVVTSDGSQGVLSAQWKFAGWSGDIESTSSYESIVMDRPHRVTANWTQGTDYRLILYLALAAATVVIVVVLAVVLVRRRKPKQAPPETQPQPTTEAPPEPTPEIPSEVPSLEVPLTRFCIFCGADLDAGASFCSKCGRSQVSSDS